MEKWYMCRVLSIAFSVVAALLVHGLTLPSIGQTAGLERDSAGEELRPFTSAPYFSADSELGKFLSSIPGKPISALDRKALKTRKLESQIRNLLYNLPAIQQKLFSVNLQIALPTNLQQLKLAPMALFSYEVSGRGSRYLVLLHQWEIVGFYSPAFFLFDPEKRKLIHLFDPFTSKRYYYNYILQAKDILGDGKPEFILYSIPAVGSNSFKDILEIFKLINGRLQTIFFATLQSHEGKTLDLNIVLHERPTFITSLTEGPPRIVLNIGFSVKELDHPHYLSTGIERFNFWRANAEAVFNWDATRKSFQAVEDTRSRLIDQSNPFYRYDLIWERNLKYSIGGAWDAAPHR